MENFGIPIYDDSMTVNEYKYELEKYLTSLKKVKHNFILDFINSLLPTKKFKSLTNVTNFNISGINNWQIDRERLDKLFGISDGATSLDILIKKMLNKIDYDLIVYKTKYITVKPYKIKKLRHTSC